MTHKDCIHSDVCHLCSNGETEKCQQFKDRANFVKVVRCKDCDILHNEMTGCPNLNGLIPPPNHYCGMGKRKN